MNNEPFRVLVLSDVHFGSWSHYTCDRSDLSNKPHLWAAELLVELGQCLTPPAAVHSPPYDSIVLNGDLTSVCEEEGFVATKSLVNGLLSKNYIKSRRDFLILPGNHDIRWDRGGKPLTPRGKHATFREKYHGFVGQQHAVDRHLGVLRVYEEQKIALIGLDSCRIEGSENPGIGFVGFDQLDGLIRTIEVLEVDQGPFRRIAFVHHHIEAPGEPPEWVLMPTEDRRFSFTADAKRIREGLDVFKIDFLIHGHYHTPELSAVANKARVAGRIVSAGSAAGALSRCADKTRQFMLLELSDDRMVIHDFRKKGKGNWIPSKEDFDLLPRDSVPSSDSVTAFRKERIFDSVSELDRYGGWARASSFFAGDPDTVASVKHGLVESEIWKKDPAGFEAAWAKLAQHLEKNGKRALARYQKALQDPQDSPTLAHHVVKILKGLKR